MERSPIIGEKEYAYMLMCLHLYIFISIAVSFVVGRIVRPTIELGAEIPSVKSVCADFGFPQPNGYGTNNLSFKTDTH